MIKIACPNCDSFSSRLSFSRIKRQLRFLGKRLQNWTLSTACFRFCCLVFPFSYKRKEEHKDDRAAHWTASAPKNIRLTFFLFLTPLLVTRRISLKSSRLCLTINNDRIWLLWNNGGNSFKIYARFFKISDYHTSGRFKPSAKLMIRQILPVGVILVDFLGCK